MFSPVMKTQENNIVSATKAILETHIAAKRFHNYPEKIIKKTRIRVQYTTEKMSKLTVTSMN